MVMVGKGIIHSVTRQALLSGLALFAVFQSVSAGAVSYAEALRLAREGDTAAALLQFEELLQLAPDDRRLRYDYIVTLQWAGRNEAVLQQAGRIRLDASPIYVLEAIGKAARNTRHFDYAIQCYRNALRQDTSRLPSTLGLALALADARRTDEALQLLQPRAEREPQSIPLWEALAYVHQRRREWFNALAAYDHILALDADHRGALRGRIMVISHMGAPHLALSYAEAAGDVFTREEMDRLLADRAAVTLRWGRLGSPLHEKRYDDVDRAIAYLEQNLARFRQNNAQRQHISNALYDMLLALRDRKRMQDAIRLYESMREQGVDFTSYALIAAADAYLYEEQPEVARDLYLRALEHEPANIAARFSLFYAYVEAEQFDEAFATIDALSEELQPWQKGEAKGVRNDDKLGADSTASAGRAYGNLLEDAQEMLVPLQQRAPHNVELRNLLAHIYMWRGWQHRALREFDIVIADDPKYLGARIGRARALFNLREYRATQQHLQGLLAAYPENKHILEAWRLWGIHNRRELRIDATASRGDSLVGTSDDQTIDTHMYSQPLDYHYRVYLHDYRARATVVEGHVDYRRAGIGIEYRRPHWLVSAEVTRDYWFGGDEGVGLRADWTPDDHWQLGFGYDSHAIDLPLRGRFFDITGRNTNIDLGYRVSDTRSFGAGLRYIDFSDGNERNAFSTRYSERLYTQPHFKTDGILRLFASRNSLTNVPYFSPRRDHAIEYTLDNEWLTYRDYGFRFYQRLAVTFGRYYQDGFDGENTWAVQYEHDW
ncbi:MAG: poly-beta-1,6 N-acetyl-D-glucosamine export porin PgaA, partial [Granulosicoccaceae bacterium]